MAAAPADRPRFVPAGPGMVSVHATAVALGDAGLLIAGPSGAGKSTTAAQMLAFGATLVADDLVLVAVSDRGLVLKAPRGGQGAIELRGLGIVPVAAGAAAPLRGVLWLGPSRARLPEQESLELLGSQVAMLRHPADHAVAAKAMIWLRSLA